MAVLEAAVVVEVAVVAGVTKVLKVSAVEVEVIMVAVEINHTTHKSPQQSRTLHNTLTMVRGCIEAFEVSQCF